VLHHRFCRLYFHEVPGNGGGYDVAGLPGGSFLRHDCFFLCFFQHYNRNCHFPSRVFIHQIDTFDEVAYSLKLVYKTFPPIRCAILGYFPANDHSWHCTPRIVFCTPDLQGNRLPATASSLVSPPGTSATPPAAWRFPSEKLVFQQPHGILQKSFL